jgi:hypothetical protein
MASSSAISKPKKNKLMNTENNDYEVGYKKPPIATRFKKGVCPNLLGRGGKKKTQKLDPGQILQAIDNEAIMVNVEGERKRMRKAEINFRQLFTKAIKGSLPDARTIAKMAAQYFGPEAEGPSETFFIIVSDTKGKPSRKLDPGKRGQTLRQVSAGSLFRKVAMEKIQIEGIQSKMPRVEAYMRQIQTMALNKNGSAALLLDRLRRQFPGDLRPGDPITLRISENQAKY